MNKFLIMILASGIFLLDIAMKSLNDDINPNAQSGAGKIYIPRDDASRDWLDASAVSWEQIAEHYAPSESIEDWRKLQPERHWRVGYSAFELAHSWENANPDLPPEIQSLFYGPVKLLSATPEHKTPLPGGRAASQSDVLAFIRIKNRVCAVAVEGKVDEPFGETVGKWSENASSGKIKRLKHISKKLGLPYPPATEIRYQLLHRTASAVIEAQHFKADCAAMIVQSFSPENKWFEDYSAFLDLFGIQSAKQDKLYKTDKPGITLYFGWAGSQKQPVAAVSDTAVAKTTTPSTLTVTQTTEASISWLEWMKANLTKIIVGLLSVISLIGLGRIFRGRNSNVKRKTNQQAEIVAVGAVDETQKQRNKENGDRFERYVLRKFVGKFGEVRATSDKNVDGKYSADSTDPDFEMTLKTGCKYAVDAKFTRGSRGGIITCASSDAQLKRYKAYQEREKQKTFIVLGVGEPADDPRDVYIIPVEDLITHQLPLEQLVGYKQTNKGNFYYDEEKETLVMMRPL